MGGFYGSIQIRTTDRAAVKTAAEAVAKEKSLRCLIGPEINGWVGVCAESNSGVIMWNVVGAPRRYQIPDGALQYPVQYAII